MSQSRIIVPLATVLLLGGCGGGADLERPDPRSATVVLGTLTDVENWNPYLTMELFSTEVLHQLYPTLALEQDDWEEGPPSFEPHLAERWERSDDGLSLTFHLRDDAVWSDGTPVTADDVVFTWRAQTSPEVGWIDADLKDRIVAVEAVDPTTVRFRFDRDYPYQVMDANDGHVIPAAWAEIPFAQWEATDWRERATSAGPFVLAEHRPDQQIVLEANPRYWEPERPRLERVVWRVVPDQTSMLLQLMGGEIDYMGAVPPSEAERIRADDDLRLIEIPDRRQGFIGWNLRRPPFDDVRVRRAMTLGIDRDAVIEAAFRGYARRAVGPVLSGMWAHDPSLEPLPYDPDAARELLREAGFRDVDGDGVVERDGAPFEFEIITNAGNDTREDICQLVAGHLRRIGVEAQPRFVEYGALIDRLDAGEFDAMVIALAAATQVDLAAMWRTAPEDELTYNWIGFSDPAVDRLLDRADAATTAEEQRPLFHRVQRTLHEQQPWTMLYEGTRLDALSRRVENARIDSGSQFDRLDDWSVGPS